MFLQPESAPEWDVEVGSRVSNSEVSSIGSFPNHEELPFALRAVGGSMPTLVPIMVVVVAMGIAALESPSNQELLLFVAAFAGLFGAMGLYGVVWMRQRTPTSVKIDGTGLVGVWGHSGSKQLRVEFDRITSLNPSGWTWIHAGRGTYCRFTPPTISYETTGMGGKPVDHLFVTEPLRQRVAQAREHWMEASRHTADSPLQSDELTEQEARDLGEV